MWELDHKEGWAQKSQCFWTVLLEKTLESPLDHKEIKLVNPKGNQPLIFIRRTGAEAEGPIVWPPDAKNQTWLSNWTTTNHIKWIFFLLYFLTNRFIVLTKVTIFIAWKFANCFPVVMNNRTDTVNVMIEKYKLIFFTFFNYMFIRG